MSEDVTTPALEIDGVDLWFGGTHAVDQVTFSIAPGEVFGIIGPNGAGKSSLLNCINGYYRPQSGRIRYQGTDLLGKRPYRIARMGIGRTFQNIELVAESSVLDNVMLGRHTLMRSTIASEILQLPGARRQERTNRAACLEILELLELAGDADVPVSDLPYGRQKLVELARAVATEPRLLLLDEPTAGMTGEERTEVGRQLRALSARTGITLVLIEHDTKFIRSLTHRVAVLDFGKLIALGTPDEVMSDPAVVEAYLGSSENIVEDLIAQTASVPTADA
jgi:branched-chain amino acid transport system ATP-binding protein